MSISTEETSGFPIFTGTVAQAIDAVQSINLPTSQQRQKFGGLLTMVMSIEVQNARIRWDGSNPSTTNGILFPVGVYTFRGETWIQNLKIIGVAAGGFINYGFYVGEVR